MVREELAFRTALNGRPRVWDGNEIAVEERGARTDLTQPMMLFVTWQMDCIILTSDDTPEVSPVRIGQEKLQELVHLPRTWPLARPKPSSERARGCKGLVKVICKENKEQKEKRKYHAGTPHLSTPMSGFQLAGRRWWLRGYLAGRPRQGGLPLHSRACPPQGLPDVSQRGYGPLTCS